MKNFLSLFLAALITAAVALGASTYTKQNARVVRWASTTTYNAAGTVIAVPTEVLVVSQLVNNANSGDIVASDNQAVRFNLLDPSLAAVNITAAGKTVTYPQLAALLRQAALDQANAAGIP